MATHVVTATTTSPTPSGNQFSVYGQPSPVNSATATPSNNSPTSPRQQYLPLNNRQLRPPKAPLYVPAALRPTERPQKHSPPTPPRSVHGSLDSLNDGEEQTVSSRRSTMDSTTSGVSRLAENEWMRHEHLGQVTGLPTRDHWKVRILPPPFFSSSPFFVHDPGVRVLIYPIGWREHASRCRTSRSITTNGVLATPMTLQNAIENMMLTTCDRLMQLHPTATPQPAAPPLGSFFAGITAATVGMSFAPPTPPSTSPSTNPPASTPTGCRRGHATFAGTLSSAGKSLAPTV